jgi:uncharacterized membrane protein YqjE
VVNAIFIAGGPQRIMCFELIGVIIQFLTQALMKLKIVVIIQINPEETMEISSFLAISQKVSNPIGAIWNFIHSY